MKLRCYTFTRHTLPYPCQTEVCRAARLILDSANSFDCTNTNCSLKASSMKIYLSQATRL